MQLELHPANLINHHSSGGQCQAPQGDLVHGVWYHALGQLWPRSPWYSCLHAARRGQMLWVQFPQEAELASGGDPGLA